MQFKSHILDFISYKNGVDGAAQYVHIKYSDDGETFTANNGETLGAWIGILVDFNEEDSTNFDDYTWKKFTEDVDDELNAIRVEIRDVHAEISQESDKIRSEVSESYLKMDEYERYQSDFRTEMEQTATGITGRVSLLERSMDLTKEELQAQINTITKYFTFDINGMTIGQVNNPNKVVIDNDEISILVNNVPVQKFDANGKALIPELKVTKSIDLFGYSIEQDANGNVNCRWSGDFDMKLETPNIYLEEVDE